MDKKHKQIVEFAELGTIKDGVYESPILYSKTTLGSIRTWQVFVGLFEHDQENPVSITMEMIQEKEEDESAFAHIWTFSEVLGTDNPTQPSEHTVIKKGKNTGSINYTTPLTQALFNARSRYNSKVRKGATTNKESLTLEVQKFEDLLERNKDQLHPWRIFPEALHNYDKYKHKLPQDIVVQRKRDGTRFIVVYHPSLKDYPEVALEKKGIDGYSRGRETYEGQDHILEELLPVLEKYPGFHLDGELYKHGLSLQEISGESRREKAPAKQLEYYIFDGFYIDQPDMPFNERSEILDRIFEDLNKRRVQYVKRVVNHHMTKQDLNEWYEKFLDEGYEGVVVRDPQGLNKFGITREIRSYQTQKLKPREDAEWPCIDFTQGKRGKEVGAIIYICEAITPSGRKKTFRVTPNLSYEKRYKLFKTMSKIEPNGKTHFENNWKGEPYKISYSIISKDNVPQQPKGLGFREKGT